MELIRGPRAFEQSMAAALADVVEWVGQLESTSSLGRAEEVAPLVADVANDDIPGVLQLLPLGGLVGYRGAMEPGLLERQVHPPGDALAAEVSDGDGPLVFRPACDEHRLDAHLE